MKKRQTLYYLKIMKYETNCTLSSTLSILLCTLEKKAMNVSECDSDIDITETLYEKMKMKRSMIFSINILTIVIPSSFQVAVIIKTSQFKLTSTYLTLNLAISDVLMAIFGVLMAIFGQIPYTFMLANETSCTLETVIHMTRSFFFSLLKLLLLFISYDRYLHIKSPYRHFEHLTVKKLRCLELLCLLLASVNATFSGIDNIILHLDIPILQFLMFFMIVISILYSYLRSVKLLIKHKVRKTKFCQHDKNVTKLAKFILLTFAFFHITSFGILIINTVANTQYKHFVYLVTQDYIGLHSPINTLNFFCVNRQGKRYMKNLFRKYIYRNN